MKTGSEISVSVKQRDVAMDLLRIIAMVLVLVVHSNFKSLHVPTGGEIAEEPTTSFLRFFVQSISVCCVNVFVLISGWFGIHQRLQKFISLLFQIVFFAILGFLIAQIINSNSTQGLKEGVLNIWYTPNYWFLRSYIILYAFSPVLNQYIEYCNDKKLLETIFATYLCQILFGWYFASSAWYSNGYSPLAFFGLYLIGAYLRKKRMERLTSLKCFSVYLLSTFLISIAAFILVWGGKNDICDALYTYNSPIVMISSIALFLAFTRMKFSNIFVTNIAPSCLAIYLLHCHPSIFDEIYCKFFNEQFHFLSYSDYLIVAGGFIMLFFMSSILLDRLRMLIWNISIIIYSKLSTYSSDL